MLFALPLLQFVLRRTLGRWADDMQALVEEPPGEVVDARCDVRLVLVLRAEDMEIDISNPFVELDSLPAFTGHIEKREGDPGVWRCAVSGLDGSENVLQHGADIGLAA